MSGKSPERLFKVVFVGDSGVGKSSFIHRFCSNSFKHTFSATIGQFKHTFSATMGQFKHTFSTTIGQFKHTFSAIKGYFVHACNATVMYTYMYM